MKVIHLIGGGDIGGAKSHVLQLVRELGRHIEVTLVSLRRGPFHDDAVRMGLDARVIRSGNIVKDIHQVLRLVRDNKYDIIHSHGAKANMFATIIKRATGIPVVTTIHSDYRLDYMHSVLKRYSYGVINMISLRKIDYHIGVSDSFRNMLISRKFDPQRIFTVYNGIPFDNEIPPCSRREFFDRYKIPFPEDSVVIGILARLDPVKDHETFLKAAAEVYRQNNNTRFLIAGWGDELKPRLVQLAEKLGIKDVVAFPGRVYQPFDYFQSIDINVLTSISESFPYAILEGARMAKATVSTRVGGLGDLIESGVNGYLVKPRDWKALAQHLSELSTDAAKRNEMGRLLWEKARRLFSLDNMCRTQLNIYSRILCSDSRVKKDGKRYDIAILGYYGYRNSGDEAILNSTIQSMRAVDPDVSFAVFSKKPGKTIRDHEVNSIHRFNLLRAIGILKKTRLFLAGGGNLIQDNTSTRSILYYLYMLGLARRCGAKTMLFANGIGPIVRNINRKLVIRTLNRLDAITLREPVSFDELKSMGVDKPPIHITSDPAIMLESAPDSAVDELIKAEGIPADKPLVGISVRKWADLSYLEEIAAIADFCAESLGAHPVFIPMQYPSDLNICRSVMDRMRSQASVIARDYPPEYILGFTGRLSLMIGMRLHSLIYAACRGVPMLGMIYEPKVDAFLKEVSQPSTGSLLKMDHDHVTGLLREIWANREKISEELKCSRNALLELSRRNVEIAFNLLKSK
jgi:polysaccharide pyruvyl transferase CsaB